jgi:hypothetical protein
METLPQTIDAARRLAWPGWKQTVILSESGLVRLIVGGGFKKGRISSTTFVLYCTKIVSYTVKKVDG